MYQVKIVCGSIKEINNLCNVLDMDLWTGVIVDSQERADAITCACYAKEPWIEMEVKEVI